MSTLDEPSLRRDLAWIAMTVAMVLAAALGLRFGTDVLRLPADVRDEYLMKAPIDAILDRGWSVETAINYQEVKGPAFYWSYAIVGEVIGGSINELRLVSVAFFVASIGPLLFIARRAGVPGAGLPTVGLLWIVLPYNAYISQLLFSEPSFVFYAACLMAAYMWGFGDSRDRARLVVGPILVGVLLSILLHHRPHAAAFAIAMCLVAIERDRVRAWPWVLACGLAAVSRLPLWLHWGGLVTSDYQGVFGFGFRPAGLTYMLAALLPFVAWFLVPTGDRFRSRAWWILVIGGAISGALLAVFAAPDLARRIPDDPSTLPATIPRPPREFAGVIATMVTTTVHSATGQTWVLALLSSLGGAAMGGFAAAAWERSDADGIVRRLAFWTIAGGVPLYVMTSGPVFDRYLLVWCVLLPVVWLRALPRWVIVPQTLVLGAVLAYHAHEWLMLAQ
jgi:hypothetical protein